jgi:uncharacterized damage-inducible protein DinB
VMSALNANRQEVLSFFAGIPESQAGHRYAEGKWTIRQVLQHICDTERILAYRALRFARQDPQQPLPFDENKYAATLGDDERTLAAILDEFETIRQASLSLFRGFNDQTLVQSGKTAAGEVTVVALGYMICGHAIHHMNVVKDRYLGTKNATVS